MYTVYHDKLIKTVFIVESIVMYIRNDVCIPITIKSVMQMKEQSLYAILYPAASNPCRRGQRIE